MSSNSSSYSSSLPVIHLGAFLRTLIAPLIVWSVTVIVLTLAGQPGVACVTPVAWLLALWSGGRYIRFTGARPERWPLLGPALVGALLGLGMGVLFAIVSSQAMPVGNDPAEIAKAQTLTLIMAVGGIIVCTGLSALTANLTLRRMARR
jgi:hypothetical protein